MTACQTLAKSLSATPLATSYPTTLFSLPPPYHYELTDLSSYTLYLFLYDKVLRRPVEPAPRKRTLVGASSHQLATSKSSKNRKNRLNFLLKLRGCGATSH